MSEVLQCNDCGQFCTRGTMADKYDFNAMELMYEHCRCFRCTQKLGPVKSNAMPANGDMGPYEWAFGDDLEASASA